MTSSKTIAGLMGPTLVAMGAAMLLNLASMPALLEQVSHDFALIFIWGILIFVAGLAIVRAHNVWAGGWPVLVTVLGWLAMLGGLLRMFFPSQLAGLAVTFANSTGLIVAVAVILLVLGAFLSFKAYGPG